MSRPCDVKWLDGKNANGHYILEMFYKNGSRAYMKNKSREKIDFYYNLLADCPDVLRGVIYTPAGEEVASYAKAA